MARGLDSRSHAFDAIRAGQSRPTEYDYFNFTDSVEPTQENLPPSPYRYRGAHAISNCGISQLKINEIGKVVTLKERLA